VLNAQMPLTSAHEMGHVMRLGLIQEPDFHDEQLSPVRLPQKVRLAN
jgi:hypothetical protein